jgi:hypothetical protein
MRMPRNQEEATRWALAEKRVESQVEQMVLWRVWEVIEFEQKRAVVDKWMVQHPNFVVTSAGASDHEISFTMKATLPS